MALMQTTPGAGRKRKLTPSDEAAAYLAYKAGLLPVDEIAQCAGVSRSTMYNALRRHAARLADTPPPVGGGHDQEARNKEKAT